MLFTNTYVSDSPTLNRLRTGKSAMIQSKNASNDVSSTLISDETRYSRCFFEELYKPLVVSRASHVILIQTIN